MQERRDEVGGRVGPAVVQERERLLARLCLTWINFRNQNEGRDAGKEMRGVYVCLLLPPRRAHPPVTPVSEGEEADPLHSGAVPIACPVPGAYPLPLNPSGREGAQRGAHPSRPRMQSADPCERADVGPTREPLCRSDLAPPGPARDPSPAGHGENA